MSDVGALVVVGRVGRPHGLDGSFVVEQASEDAARFARDAVLWVSGERACVVSARRTGGRPVIRLDRPTERGAELCVPASELAPASDGAFYVFQLVGLAVEEDGGRVLGSVTDVLPGVANDALELDSGLLLPMHEDCVRSIDLVAGKIVVERGFATDG